MVKSLMLRRADSSVIWINVVNVVNGWWEVGGVMELGYLEVSESCL